MPGAVAGPARRGR